MSKTIKRKKQKAAPEPALFEKGPIDAQSVQVTGPFHPAKQEAWGYRGRDDGGRSWFQTNAQIVVGGSMYHVQVRVNL